MKKAIFVFLFVLVIGSFLGQGCNNRSLGESNATSVQARETTAKSPKNNGKVTKNYIIFYFYNNFRCLSCKKIEAYSSETVKGKFSDELKDGKISWKVINIDEPANKHFAQDYKLFTKSLVIVELVNGKETRWKNLDKVWEYLKDKTKFTSYVESEIKNFMGGS